MKLKDARDYYYFYSGKTSDLVRQVGLAGIAVIWLFKVDVGGVPKVPAELLLPLGLILAGLTFDFAQYAIATAVWGIFQRQKELAKVDEEAEFKAPRQFNWPGVVFFALKVACVGLACALLVWYVGHRVA